MCHSAVAAVAVDFLLLLLFCYVRFHGCCNCYRWLCYRCCPAVLIAVALRFYYYLLLFLLSLFCCPKEWALTMALKYEGYIEDFGQVVHTCLAFTKVQCLKHYILYVLMV